MRWIRRLATFLFVTHILAAGALLHFAGCGETNDTLTTTDEPADVISEDATEDEDVVDRDGSYFLLEVIYPSGTQVIYDEVLLDSHISYGSQHIGSAVALTIEKKLSAPFAVINLNLGFVVGSNDYPVTIEDIGAWPWTQAQSELPPSMKIIATDGSGPQLNFSSWVDGASGKYLITRWGVAPGDAIEGSLSGTLKNDGPVNATAEVKGTFRVFIPTTNL